MALSEHIFVVDAEVDPSDEGAWNKWYNRSICRRSPPARVSDEIGCALMPRHAARPQSWTGRQRLGG
jgi:hypothetical protein